MVEVLGIMAFMLSMGAFLLSAEALRRARMQNDALMSGPMAVFKKTLAETTGVVEGLNRRVARLEGSLDALQGMHAKEAEVVTAMRRDMASAQNGLAEIGRILQGRSGQKPPPAPEVQARPPQQQGRRVA